MPNHTIEDWKKAAIVGMSRKYGDRAIAKRLDIGRSTVRNYRQEAEETGTLEMDGINLEVVQ